jgi:hypothetical protein
MNVVTPDALHRLVKLAMDTGEAESVEHAHHIFAGYRIGIATGPEIEWSHSHQAALLTVLQLASRVFLGGIDVVIDFDTATSNCIVGNLGIVETMDKVGARRVTSFERNVPVICIGTVNTACATDFAVRAVFSGWRAGVVPVQVAPPFEFETEFSLAGVFAAAIAVNEAFLFVRQDTPEAGLRTIGVSLWTPDVIDDWWSDANDGPEIIYLPNKLWLLGLGHLGQAYLWALSLLPYERPEDVLLVLQDVDIVTNSTLSTSILSEYGMIGRKKTRAMADVLERRGFRTLVIERRFDETLRVLPDDPQIALCGLDNALGRRPLCEVGFKFVVEAGLGSGVNDFRAIRIHVFPSGKDPKELWKHDENDRQRHVHPAYNDLKARGLDQCGITMLSGKAVGAPFVGVAAAAFGLAEILRFLHEGPLFVLHDIDLKSLNARVSAARKTSLTMVNPGFTRSLPKNDLFTSLPGKNRQHQQPFTSSEKKT